MINQDLKKTTPSLKHSGILFSSAVILLLTIGPRVQGKELYSGIFITELILILLPSVMLLIIYKYNILKTLRLNSPGIMNIITIIFIMLFAIPIAGALNFLNLILIKLVFGKTMIIQPPAAETGIGLLLNIFIIGTLPAICEEVMFRGVLQKSFREYGTVKAILFTAFLFGLFHMDFQKLLGTFLLGALIGYIVYRTDSLFSGMVAHFTNNSFGVIMAFILNKLNTVVNPGFDSIPDSAQDLDISVFSQLPGNQLIITIIVWMVFLAFCIAAFSALTYALTANTRKKNIPYVKSKKLKYKNLIWMAPGLILIIIIYFLQSLKLAANINLFEIF